MTASLISCIVPVFNGERYLKEALDSIRAQTYRPLEIIVADVGSTDGTAAVVASYGEQIRYLSQPNAGPAAARNRGLQAATGAFVAFLDADDLWHPEKLARQMARFAARPELDLCVTHARNFWSPELDDVPGGSRDHLRLMKPLPGYLTQALLAPRTIFERVGPFNPALRLNSDTEWFLCAAEHNAVMELLPDVLLDRRLHHTNISMARGADRMASTLPHPLLEIVKASLDRRRRQNGEAILPYQFPPSDW